MCSEARTVSGSVPRADSFRCTSARGSLRSRSLASARGDRLGQMGCRQPVGRCRALPKRMSLANYSGTPLDIDVDRTVRLLDRRTSPRISACSLDRTFAWWDSSRPTPSPTPAASRGSAIPGWCRCGSSGCLRRLLKRQSRFHSCRAGSTLGPVVNDAYFGKVPSDRLRVKGPVIFFRGDGQYRSKIGLSPSRARSVAGSYDGRAARADARPVHASGRRRAHTSTRCGKCSASRSKETSSTATTTVRRRQASRRSVRSTSWKRRRRRSASRPTQQHTHVHRTFHLVGPAGDLDRIARATLGVGLGEIRNAFE